MQQGNPNCQNILRKKSCLKNMLGTYFLPKCDINTPKTSKSTRLYVP